MPLWNPLSWFTKIDAPNEQREDFNPSSPPLPDRLESMEAGMHIAEQPEPKGRKIEESEGLDIFAHMAVGQSFSRRDIAQWIVDRNEYVKHYTGSVYVAVGAIARKFAMQEAKVGVVVHDDAGERIEPIRSDHPLVKLFNQPNPVMTEFDLWFSAIAWRLVTGDSFLWKARNGFGVTTELWPMPSQWVHAVPDAVEYISGYRVHGVFNRTDVFIPKRDMLHMKEPSVDWSNNGRFYGFPQLAASASMVDLEESMLKRLYHQFRNFAPPGLHYSTDVRLEPKELKQLYSQVVGLHAAAEATGRPIVTHSGLKADEFSKSTREMDYQKSIEVAMEYILAIFGVPKAIVGLVKDTNRANMQAAMLAFCENTVNPLLVAIGQSLTLSLAHEYDERLVIYFDPCTVEDAEQMRKNIETASKQGAVTPNEIRDVMLGKGSFEQGGDRALVQGSMKPAPHGNDELPEELQQPQQQQQPGQPPPQNSQQPQNGQQPKQDKADREAQSAQQNGNGQSTAKSQEFDEDMLFDVDKSGNMIEVASGGGGERFFSQPSAQTRTSRLRLNGSHSTNGAK